MNPEDQNSNFNQPKKPGWNYSENPYGSDRNSSGVANDPKYHPVEDMSYILKDPSELEKKPAKERNPIKVVFIVITILMVILTAVAVGAIYLLGEDGRAPSQQSAPVEDGESRPNNAE